MPSTAQIPHDVGRFLDHGPWTAFQKAVLALTALAIVLDGFDIQLLAFAIPSLVKEWHVPRDAFAPILALGLIGMSLGTAAAGLIGDGFGRRRALIVSVAAFGIATVAAAFADGVAMLGLLRFLAGAGLGGAVPNATALTAEFTPLRRRALAVSLTIVCVPLGGALAGLAASRLLVSWGWRSFFMLGGFAAIGLAGVLVAFLPESARFLVRRPQRWPELVRLLGRLQQPVEPNARFADAAEQRKEARQGSLLAALFGPATIRDTICLWLGFLSSMSTVYLALNWLPALLAAQGFGVGAASSGLAAYNLGGVAGAIVCGSVTNRLGSRWTMIAACSGSIATAFLLAVAPPSAFALACHGFFANGTQTMMFALAAHIYPTAVRAGGVAASIAFARLGAVGSAFLGALLIKAGPSQYFGAIGLLAFAALAALAMVAGHIPRFRPATFVRSPE